MSFVENESWNEWIPYYTFAYNITPHVDTEYSPFELVFGKLPSLPGDEVMNHPKVYNFDNYANELKARMKYSLENARKILDVVKNNRRIESHKKSNSIELKIGDLVLVKVGNRTKSEPPYNGPYPVVDIDDLNILVKVKNNIKSYHKNLLKKYYD